MSWNYQNYYKTSLALGFIVLTELKTNDCLELAIIP